MANYMDEVLRTLREEYGIDDENALQYMRAELLRSWQNGIERGKRGNVCGTPSRHPAQRSS